MKELGYYCTRQGSWLGEVDIKETLSGCQIQFMNQEEKLSGDTQCSSGLGNCREAPKGSKQGLFTETAGVSETQEAVAAIIPFAIV